HSHPLSKVRRTALPGRQKNQTARKGRPAGASRQIKSEIQNPRSEIICNNDVTRFPSEQSRPPGGPILFESVPRPPLAMFLKYGSYMPAQNDPAVQISKRAVFSPRGFRRAVRETWRIVGVLHAANQPSLTAAIAALRSAYNVNGLDLALYLDDQ